MCNFSNDDEKSAYGFLVDAPEIRHLIEEFVIRGDREDLALLGFAANPGGRGWTFFVTYSLSSPAKLG